MPSLKAVSMARMYGRKVTVSPPESETDHDKDVTLMPWDNGMG